MRTTTLATAALALLALAACNQNDVDPATGVTANDTPGLSRPTARGVNLAASCSEPASAAMQHGVSELHNMMYLSARSIFEQALAADPNCVMAHWGVAMTYIHPLWPDRPSDAQLEAMQTRVAEALQHGAPTAREQAFLETTRAYYEAGMQRSETERLGRFAAAWRTVHEQFPDDPEATAFYALAHLATADPDDKSYRVQKEAGRLAEQVLAAAPDHPGAHHYVIHAYDYPGLAERALPVAMNYGRIAPETAHALHMMSHIFTRLGMWQESVEWNQRSADAAWRVSLAQGGQSSHYHHALDYLGYAYLQQARDGAALATVNNAQRTDLPYGELNRRALAHALAALPARYALERRDWAAAAALRWDSTSHPGLQHAPPAYLAMLYYARALGLAHQQRFAEAAADVVELDAIAARLAAEDVFWAGHVQIKASAARAWLEFQQGNRDKALALMRRAGQLEAATNKHAVTPGYVLPARELLGELLLELQMNEEALAAFEATLADSPGRLNSLHGKARALERMGETDKAGVVFDAIRAMTAQADHNARPWLSVLRTGTDT